MLDRELIKKFRNYINDNSDYILHKYENDSGKNKWNIICSAMDWIDVAIDSINSFSVETQRKLINEYSMKVYLHISSIDIIFESVQQLNRVINDTNDILFKGNKGVFRKNYFNDDNLYFKHVRAVFGAHPVNIFNKEANERWYASWPTVQIASKYDFQVFLYPNKTEKKMKTFGIYFNELEEYAHKIYVHLDTLINVMEKDFKEYKLKQSSNEILYKGELLNDLVTAKKELKNRLFNEGIDYLINEAIFFLSTSSSLEENKELVEEFKDKVEGAAYDLKQAVQILDFDDKPSYSIFRSISAPNHHYEFQKYQSFLDGIYESSHYDFFDTVYKELKPYIKLDKYMSDDELKLLVKVGLYNYQKLN